MTERDDSREQAAIISPHVRNIQQQRPEFHPLVQLVPGDSSQAEQSIKFLESHLRTMLQTVHSQSTQALLMVIRGTSSVSDLLPTWQPLLYAVQQVFVTRYDSAKSTSLLRGLNSPRRDTMLSTHGNSQYGNQSSDVRRGQGTSH